MATVSYSSITNVQGIASHVDESTNSGDIAVNVTTPNAAQLAALSALYVMNSSNGNFVAEYIAGPSNIAAAVNEGMNLIILTAMSPTPRKFCRVAAPLQRCAILRVDLT